MNITSKQKKEKFILKYFKNGHNLRLVAKKRPLWRRRKKLELVDLETERRIGEALANIKAGNYATLSSPAEIDAYFDSLDKEDACTP